MRGLHNIGNTCYFNSSLQCLLQIPPMSNHFIKHGYSGACGFTTVYAELVRTFWKGKGPSLDVRTLLVEFQKHFPRFVLGQPHDVQEAVLCIIDILERAVPDLKPLFYGKKVQQTIYPGGKKEHEEDFSVHLMCSNSDNLQTMLEESIQWNTLTDYTDDSGKTHHVATTRNVFSEMPRIFMISFDKKSFITISEYLEIGHLRYRLLAAAAHAGIQWHGHYVAFTRHKDKWYYKNDDFVEEVTLPKQGGFYFMVYILV